MFDTCNTAYSSVPRPLVGDISRDNRRYPLLRQQASSQRYFVMFRTSGWVSVGALGDACREGFPRNTANVTDGYGYTQPGGQQPYHTRVCGVRVGTVSFVGVP